MPIFVPIMKGRPPLNRCLVRMDEAEMTAGGIILPAEVAKSNIGLVVQSAIEGVLKGSKVALNEDEIKEITVEGGKYASVHRDAILLIKQ